MTRDYGAEPMVEATVTDPSESETVIRFLDREAEIGTRYGGAFVQSIDGLAGTYRDGRSFDWFFYVDGVESPVGSAERDVQAGQRIWWDYRDWTNAMRVPAVVGSWPEPFVHGAAEDALPVRVECLGAAPPCETVAAALQDEGVEAEVSDGAGGDGSAALRLLVGPWAQVGDDPAAAELDGGPQRSGVFARFERAGEGYALVGLDQRAQPAVAYRRGAGIVAAVRDGDDPPTWLVTGTDPAGVRAAAKLLDPDQLKDRYALLASGARVLALPVAR